MTVFLQSLGGHFEVFKWFIFLAQLLTTQKKERKKERRKERKKEGLTTDVLLIQA